LIQRLSRKLITTKTDITNTIKRRARAKKTKTKTKSRRINCLRRESFTMKKAI
jgi:hypothetical protein